MRSSKLHSNSADACCRTIEVGRAHSWSSAMHSQAAGGLMLYAAAGLVVVCAAALMLSHSYPPYLFLYTIPRPEAIALICKNGLLKIGHPNNPSASTDPGYFGDPRSGVYVGQCSDYVLKYSNALLPVASGQTVKIILYKVLPGRVFHCNQVEMGREPEPGHDSHESPHSLEWYLPLEGQCCPIAVLTIKAEDRCTNQGGDTADDS